MKKTILAAAIMMQFGGCAVLQEFQRGQDSSYVEAGISTYETEKIAVDLSVFLSRQFPPAKTILAFKPELTLFQEILLDELSRKGYGIATGEAPADAIPIKYYVTVLGNGILVRVKYQGQVASRYHARTENGLSSGSVAIRGALK